MLVTLLFLPLSISITTSAMTNPLSKTKLAGADPIFAVSTAFTESSHPEKISVGVGAYRGETGEPLVMAAVTAAKGRLASQISQNWTHEYIPIGGLDLFLGGARTLLFGKSPSSAVTSIQSLSGTGALRLFADLAFQNPSFTTIAIPNPTWGNHKDIFAAAGLKTIGYTYLDPSTPKKPSIDFTKTLSSLSSLPPNTIALFHLCAHNPSGVDFSKSQWKELAELCKSNQLFPCFDNAYQGFATGDLEDDAWPVRYFVDQKIPLFAACSFAKNMGLYGERIGALHYSTPGGEDEAAAVLSQLKLIARRTYSSPPQFGAAVAGLVLSDVELREMWVSELKEMAERIKSMRVKLRGVLEKNGGGGETCRDWSHVTEQIGMFSYTGLREDEVAACAEQGLFMLKSGRISLAGVNDGNVERVGEVMIGSIEACKKTR
ncbi:hypothetical protein ScalyP_jg6456 [Parmales sp. scaly parma]|nr:hypothetical protein ScalyP_jg6456 [Parmales sp. scaly parma]